LTLDCQPEQYEAAAGDRFEVETVSKVQLSVLVSAIVLGVCEFIEALQGQGSLHAYS
jgi:hypothetical protein